MMSKKILFVPGLGEKPNHYKKLSKRFNVLNIDWNKPTLKLNHHPKILIAFSFGGILVLEYSLKKKVDTLILCSLTPSIETLKKVKARKVVFLVGEKEKWELKNIRRVAKTLKCENSIIVISGAGHKLAGNYEKKLIDIISKIKN